MSTTETAIASREPEEDQPLARLTPALVKQKEQDMVLLKNFIKSQLKEGIHYWTAPKRNRPSLLKAGANELFKLFNYRAECTVECKAFDQKDWDCDATCTVFNRRDQVIGNGFGSYCTFGMAADENLSVGQRKNKAKKMAEKSARIDAALNCCAADSFFDQFADISEGDTEEQKDDEPRFTCDDCGHVHRHMTAKSGKEFWWCILPEGEKCQCKLQFSGPPEGPQSPQDEPNGGQQGQGSAPAPKATQKRMLKESQPITSVTTPALVALLYHDAAKAAQEQVKDLIETDWLNPGDFKALFLTQLVEVFFRHGVGGLIPNEHFPLNGNGVMTYTHVLPTHEILANIRHDLLSVNWRALVGVEKEE